MNWFVFIRLPYNFLMGIHKDGQIVKPTLSCGTFGFKCSESHSCSHFPSSFSYSLWSLYVCTSGIDDRPVVLQFLEWWVVLCCSFWEKLGMINVWRWRLSFSVRQFLRNDVQEVKLSLSPLTRPEVHLSLNCCMNRMVDTEMSVLSRMVLQASLPDDDIVRKCLFSSEFLNTSITIFIPNLLPAESLVFWVDEACIFEASKRSCIVSRVILLNTWFILIYLKTTNINKWRRLSSGRTRRTASKAISEQYCSSSFDSSTNLTRQVKYCWNCMVF